MVPTPCRRPVLRSARLLALFAAAALALALGAPPAQAIDKFLFSTDANETLQFNSLFDEQVWEFDTTKAPFSEISGPLAQTGPAMFVEGEDIDAFTWRDGVYFFSTDAGATFTDNALAVDADDIVRYDPGAPVGSRATLFFDPDLYGTDSEVDAISFHSDGDLLISFNSDETFAGLSVLDGDILKFDPLDPANTRTIFFSESTFTTGNEDIAAFEFVSSSEMYLTARGTPGLPGLPSFANADIILWDGATASIAVGQSEFSSSSGGFNLDAIGSYGSFPPVPEPSGITLLAAAGSLGLRRRRK